MPKSSSMLRYFLYFIYISGGWNCKAANSFSTIGNSRATYNNERFIAFNSRHVDGQDNSYNVNPIRRKQNDNLSFIQRGNGMNINSITKHLRSKNNNNNRGSQTGFHHGIKMMPASTPNQLRGGDTITYTPTIEKRNSSKNIDSAVTGFNKNAFGSIIALGGIFLMSIELYSYSSSSAISIGPIKLILTTLLSVGFWSSLAPVASLCMKLSPMTTVLKFRKEKHVGGLPLLPYSAMFTLTFVLAVYGFLIGDPMIMLTHGTGNLISLFYCTSYLQNCPSTATHLPGTPNLHKLVSGSILSATCLVVLLRGKNAAHLAGMSSIILSSTMYIGPLTVIRSAIEKRSARDIPLPFAINSFINSLAWSVYGIFKINNWMIYTPCLIGFLSSSTQIILNILFHENDKKQLKYA